MFLAAGSGEGADQDCAVILRTTRVSAPGETYACKYFRTPTREGFAAEIGGVGSYEGEVAQQAASCVLVIQRTAGQMEIYARHGVAADRSGGNITALLYDDVAPGIMTVDILVRDQAVFAWNATLEDFRLANGFTTYARTASWWRERDRHIVLENFIGDEADPNLWTVTSSGGSNALIVQDGEALLQTDKSAGFVQAEFPTITGDFKLVFDVRWKRTKNHTASPATTDTPFRLTVRPVADLPRFHVTVNFEEDKTRAEITKQANDAAAEQVQDLDDSLPWDVATEMRGRLHIERIGDRFIIRFEDVERGGQFGDLAQVPIVGYVPSVPVKVLLRGDMTSSGGRGEFYISNWAVTSPHGIPDDLEAWPDIYYGGAQLAEETETTDAGSDRPYLSDLTLLDARARRPFWRIVAASSSAAGESSNAALRPGPILDSWANRRDGALVIPVKRADSPLVQAFVFVDLGYDQVWQVEDTTQWAHFGPIRWRHLGKVPTSPQATASRYVDGAPILYEEVPRLSTSDVRWFHVWVTDTGIRVTAWDNGVQQGSADLCVAATEPGITFEVHRVAIIQPTATKPAAMVVAATRDGDGVVAVYRDLNAAYTAGNEASQMEHADLRYSGQDASVNNQGAGWVTDLLYRKGAPDVAAIHARWDASDSYVVTAVTRPGGLTLFQERTAPDAPDAHHFNWTSETIPGGDPSPQAAAAGLEGPPTSVWLTSDAQVAEDVVGGQGMLAVQESGFFEVLPATFVPRGAAQVISLHNMQVRSTIDPDDVGADATKPGSLGIVGLETPPGVLAGLRLFWGYGLDQAEAGNIENAIVEYDEWAITNGPWDGPHIGGTEVEILGWGLEAVIGVKVGGVDCFRVAWESIEPADPVLRAVTRALGWIENGDTPVMSDAALEATPLWPKDMTLVLEDGATLTIDDGFTYESRMCIEHSLARMAVRVPDEVIANDPKTNTLQRHMLIAVAWQVCQLLEEFFDIIERDTYRAEAQGEGLDAWAASHGVTERPIAGMSDTPFAAFIVAKAFGNRVTVKAIKDLIEPIFGYRPTVEEGYREFTVVFDPAQAGGLDWRTNFYGGAGAADPLRTGFHNRNFWGGDDPRVVAARQVLQFCRATGVLARVRIDQ